MTEDGESSNRRGAEGGNGAPDAGGNGTATTGLRNDEPADRAELQRKADEHWELYLRAAADLENLRRRAARDVENARKYGVERLAERLLPVLDSLDAGVSFEHADAESLREGTRATLRLLLEALESVGVRQIDPGGEVFDPARHEAIAMRPSADAEPGTVVEVVQKGFEIQDRLLRPARVLVAQDPEQGSSA